MYREFDGKLDCFLAAIEAGRELITARIAEAMQEVSDGSLQTVLRAISRAYLETCAREPDHTRAWVLELAAAGPEGIEARDRYLDGFAALMREIDCRYGSGRARRRSTTSRWSVGSPSWSAARSAPARRPRYRARGRADNGRRGHVAMTKRRNPPRRQRPLPPFPAARRIEVGPDGLRLRSARGRRIPRRSTYRCPGCDHEIRSGTAHLVVWPAIWSEADDRRHWHTPCWTNRATRGPTRKWS